MVRVYLDTCVWCRLFDELDHGKIMEEFRAIVQIMDGVRKGRVSAVKSEVLFYEISKMSGGERGTVERLINEISSEMVRTTDKTEKIFKDVAGRCGLNAVDALHIALAIENKIDVKNPVEYRAGLNGH